MAESKVNKQGSIFTVFFLLQFAKSIAEFCDQKELYLRLGSRGLVSCDFGEFGVVGWLVGEDVDDRSPTILVEDSQTKGPGYENGEYDMFQNGSLIINKVTLQHEQMFTARIVRGSDVEHYTIEVKLYVLPVPVYPVVNGLTNQQHVVINDYSGGQVNCTMDRVRPSIELELIFLDHDPQDVFLSSIHSSINNTDGTYNVSLVSNLTVGSNLTGRLTLQCRVAGQMANYLPSVTLIDVLLLSNEHRQSYPTVNGLTNEQRVILDINREDELTCSWNGVSKPGYLKWDIINPSSDGIILTDHRTHTRDNGDGTYDLSLHSTLSVHNPSVLRVTLHCKVAAPADQWYPEITTAELLLPANFDCPPAFPVINGLTSQQHVVLDVQRTDELTCSMHRVSQEVSLQWLIITPDSSEDISMIHDQLSRSNNEDGTVNITLKSTVTVASLSINRVTLQCKVSSLPADSPQVSSTQVELLLPSNSYCLPAFPVINGLTSQQHVVLDVQRTDVLTCSMHRVSQEVSLQWLIITPDSSEDISLDNQLFRGNNEDGTVNITLKSTVTVITLSINRVTLQCKVSGFSADSPHVSSTQVELLLPSNCKDDLSQSSGIVLTILIGIFIMVFFILLISFNIYCNIQRQNSKLGKNQG